MNHLLLFDEIDMKSKSKIDVNLALMTNSKSEKGAKSSAVGVRSIVLITNTIDLTAIISAKRYNPIINAFCDKLKASGKPTMLIIGAAMRKLIHLIFGVLKSGKPFDASLAIF